MEQKEDLYLNAKNKLLVLFEKGFISDLQLYYLLNLARQKLGLITLDKSIYLWYILKKERIYTQERSQIWKKEP